MENYQELLTDYYTLIAATDGENHNVNFIGSESLDDFAELLNRSYNIEGLLTTALKCELLAAKDPEKAQKTARRILAVLDGRGPNENHNLLRGICFYAVAVASEQLTRFSAPGDDIIYLEKAVQCFPGHWNAAFLLADKKYTASAGYPEIKDILRRAAANSESVVVKARYYRQIGYFAYFAREFYDGVKYYEKSNNLTPLSKLHLSYLAASYAAIEQYENALRHFHRAFLLDAAEAALNPDLKFRAAGVNHPDIWILAETMIEQFRRLPNCENMVRMALAFELLPAPNAHLVCGQIARFIDRNFNGNLSVFENLVKGAMVNFRFWLRQRDLPIPETVFHKPAGSSKISKPRLVLVY
jgi:tetratricopeptide (TPR) repeat protein